MLAPELYDRIGIGYRDYRQADPRIMAAIMGALSDCQIILNVGAGTGSYEPTDRSVVAVEPSETMIRQRQADGVPVVRASAMNLPFADGTFDAALALLTVHHWPNQMRGLREMLRVAKRCVVFTWDHSNGGTWLTQDYFPEIAKQGKTICPPIGFYREAFGRTNIVSIPVPHDCTDGFLQASPEVVNVK
jgi:SAM-dependent methyltransferase